MTWNLRPEFEYLRHAVLVWAKCGSCKRGSYWAKLPTVCKNCGGQVER